MTATLKLGGNMIAIPFDGDLRRCIGCGEMVDIDNDELSLQQIDEGEYVCKCSSCRQADEESGE